MVLVNSAIEAGNICGGALLLSMSLTLFENIPLREKKNNAHRQQRCCFFRLFCFVLFLIMLFKDLLPGSGNTPNK